MILLAMLAGLGCKPKRGFELSTTAYIMGPTSQIVPVNADAEAHIDPAVLNAEVLIATQLADKSVKFCSGTLVAAEAGATALRVLTNHHCFAQSDAQGNATKALLAEACTSTKVHLGFIAGHTEESSSVECLGGTLRTDFDLDLGVFTLAAPPPDKYKPLALYEGDDPPADRPALIVHYPDVEGTMAEPPDGGAKLPTASATINNCATTGDFPQSEWALDRALPFGLRHTCDLIHGSSGSGLIDAQTGSVLGVNWGGIKLTEGGAVNTYNVATRAVFATAFLEGKGDEAVSATLAHRAAAAPAPAPKKGIDVRKGNIIAQVQSNGACGTLGVPAPPSALPLLAALGAPLLLAGGRLRRRR